MNCETGSTGQGCIWCCSFPVVVVGQHTIQHGLCLLKQLCHGLKHWDAHNAEKAKLHQRGVITEARMLKKLYTP